MENHTKPLYDIFPVIFAQEQYQKDNSFLYFKQWDTYGTYDGKFERLNKYSSDTWMNAFAAKKIAHYCDIETLFLNLEAKGRFGLAIYGNKLYPDNSISKELLHEGWHEGSAKVKIPDFGRHDTIYFCLFERADEPAEFIRGSWQTETLPLRDTRMAVVTCTFKREDFIRKNLGLFNEFIEKNPEYKDRLTQIVADNGQTLEKELEAPNIKIIPNINAGGAGGFTRGLLEVLDKHPDVSRVVFMDDDVEILPESFVKTLKLCDFLKEEYNESFIAGAMLDKDRKGWLFEDLGERDGIWTHPKIGGLDLNVYGNILQVNKLRTDIFDNNHTKIHNGWYYHCFNVNTVARNGLPMPLFIRGDDIEWSWRNFGSPIIYMNGIGIWHASFEWRVSEVSSHYFLIRNMLFNNFVHQPDFREEYSKFLWEYFKRLVQAYNYNGIEIFFRGLDDFINLRESLSRNPVETFKELNGIFNKRKVFKCTQKEIDAARRSPLPASEKRRKWYKFSLWNLLCPRFLFKKNTLLAGDSAPAEYFMFYDNVKVINPLTRKGEIRKMRKLATVKSLLKFWLYMAKMRKNIDAIERNCKETHQYLSTREFWDQYLELNGAESGEKSSLEDCGKESAA